MMYLILYALAGISQISILRYNTLFNQEKCDIVGGPGTYQRVLELNKNLQNGPCSDRMKGSIELVGLENQDLTEYFRGRCSSRSLVDPCIKEHVPMFKQCLNKSEVNLVEIGEKIDQQLLDYVCNQNVYNIFSKANYKCWNNGFELALHNCSPVISSAMRNPPNFKEIGCSKFKEAGLCLRSELPKYCTNTATDLFATSLDTIGSNICESAENRVRRSVGAHRYVRQINQANKMKKIEHKVKNLCIANGQVSQTVEDSLTNLSICLDEKELFEVPKQEYLALMDKCSKEPIKLFKSCLPEKYKYLPEFFFKLAESMISFLYDDFIIIGSELTPCLEKLQSKESTANYDNCVKNITDDIEDELVDSKEKFCNAWIPINECFTKQIKDACKASPELTKFETDYMTAVKKPCKNK